MKRAASMVGLGLFLTAGVASSGACGDGAGGGLADDGATLGGSGPGATGAATTGTGPEATSSDTLYGDVHAGQYNLGPVDFAETQFHNSCAPYPADVQAITGDYLAGVGLDFNGQGQLCDACILVKTKTGKSIVARIVTTGSTNGPNDIDLSPAAYDALNTGEYPRDMTWQLAKCPDTGPLRYQFQTGANVYWTSLWVRNPAVPITKVEVMSQNHPSFIELQRGSDGTLTDASGFGDGAFTLRVTGIDGKSVTDMLPSFSPGQEITSTQQLP
jgi:expansin (peptidoglycan-binding protein)